MESHAECNETTPAISFDRFHEDSDILTKMTWDVELLTQLYLMPGDAVS